VWFWAVDLNPTVGSPYFFSLTLADHFYSFLPLVWPPHPLPLALDVAPSLSLFSQVIAATPPNPSRPHPISSSPRCHSFPAWIYVALAQVSNWILVEGRRREERGRIQVDFEIISCLIVLQSNWLYVYLCESVEVLSINFVGGRTTVVVVISGNFSWVLSGDQWENHVELCHTFPTSTYALDSELYLEDIAVWIRVCCCQKTDCSVHLVDCFGLIRGWNLIIICIQNLWGILCRCFWSFCLLPLLS
jgi:hypothetical protein